ncbi:hypothetical protein Tco_1340752 [Tanacetum coccineum]
MRKTMTNDQENCYSGIISITVNKKNACDLKGKFLDDLHKTAFGGTDGEDAVEHIEYFLKIVDPIDLPNVNQDKLRVVVFPILLVGDAWKWFDEIKGSIDRLITGWVDLTGKSHWLEMHGDGLMELKDQLLKLGSDEIKPKNDETSDLEETDHDDEQEISEIFRIETNLFDYETSLCEEFKEFNYLLKIDPDLLNKDIKGFKTYGKFKEDWIYEWNKDDYEWYEALEDRELKEEALRNKAIMEGTIDDDDESSYEQWKRWNVYDVTKHDHEYEMDHEVDERQEICSNETHELPVCNIRRFEMIKYVFGDDEECVAIKEDDLAESKEINEVGEVSII